MNKRVRIAIAGVAFAFLVSGIWSPRLFSVVGSPRVKAQEASPATHGVSAEVSAQRVAVRQMTTELARLGTRYQLASREERSLLKNELHEIASKRGEMLTAMMDSDPGEVLRVAMPNEIRAGLPSAIRDYVE